MYSHLSYSYIYWIISLFQGGWREYSESQVLQMAGRAGRPQFCDTATVVIMTEESMKRHYERLIGGTQLVESNLLKHLHQHLNAEIILGSEQYLIPWTDLTHILIGQLGRTRKMLLKF